MHTTWPLQSSSMRGRNAFVVCGGDRHNYTLFCSLNHLLENPTITMKASDVWGRECVNCLVFSRLPLVKVNKHIWPAQQKYEPAFSVWSQVRWWLLCKALYKNWHSENAMCLKLKQQYITAILSVSYYRSWSLRWSALVLIDYECGLKSRTVFWAVHLLGPFAFVCESLLYFCLWLFYVRNVVLLFLSWQKHP